jgi:hypothetical protein
VGPLVVRLRLANTWAELHTKQQISNLQDVPVHAGKVIDAPEELHHKCRDEIQDSKRDKGHRPQVRQTHAHPTTLVSVRVISGIGELVRGRALPQLVEEVGVVRRPSVLLGARVSCASDMCALL